MHPLPSVLGYLLLRGVGRQGVFLEVLFRIVRLFGCILVTTAAARSSRTSREGAVDFHVFYIPSGTQFFAGSLRV